nr:PRC-barrel domain-containing protein [Primorskyibacter sedentarius]
MLGKPVLSADDETVGHVNDIIISEDGVLMGYIINVGGFIGIDTTQVYVPIDQTRLRIDGSSVEMFLDLSAAELSIVTESR